MLLKVKIFSLLSIKLEKSSELEHSGHSEHSSEYYEQISPPTEDPSLKILFPKQIFRRLTIAIAQVKVGNTCENLLDQMKFVKSYISFVSGKINYSEST